MPPVATSNAGLFLQLAEAGWSEDDLARAERAHDLACRLVPALFNGDGRPFVSHLIGLASLLQRYGRSPDAVVAGLLHSVYVHGDFGLWCSFGRARARVRDAVGDAAEVLVHRFHLLPWGTKSLARYLAEIDRCDPLDREVLVMRLANEVDHLVDGAAWYRGDARRYLGNRTARLPTFVALAQRLGVPALATDLEATLHAAATLRPPVMPHRDGVPFLVLPASARSRWLARFAPAGSGGPAATPVRRFRRWPVRGSG